MILRKPVALVGARGGDIFGGSRHNVVVEGNGGVVIHVEHAGRVYLKDLVLRSRWGRTGIGSLIIYCVAYPRFLR